MSCVRQGLHSVERNYDYACMGLDQRIYPTDQHWEFWGITVTSILDDFFCLRLVYCYAFVSLHLGFFRQGRNL
jgi:hypothetical protein